ncbi:DUF3810 domain-containing protein [Zhouia spongiae]|uniref:DUF3810 domain-containing protein n=1 Tax=Zhouia spongiae TaxID=2202721 RepID=A0ABY3YI80_9FLAO|nr:DUF3810 domain-containing protein [Zhouia spongiae]UNY97545.1 DUF3810 domain-containing protein [Zhouia spongiae]
MSKRLKTILALSIFPQIIIVKWLGNHPDWIETYYSNGFYPLLSKSLRYAFGWIPFSMGDIFYTITTILIIRFLILKGKMFFAQTRSFFREMFILISFLYFTFHLFWGMNYYRQPIHQSLNIANEYTYEELISFTDKLVDRCNNLHLKITGNDTVMVKIPYTKREIYNMTGNGYRNLAKKIPELEYSPGSIKTSMYSTALTYMGYSGYLNPFTNEAQVNGLQLDFKYPTVSCHEEAHQIGYSAENEANFVGYLAAVHNEDIYFQYSGYLYVMRYFLGEIKRNDPELFEAYNARINPGIIKNYLEVANFWRKHKTKAEPAFKQTFNTFLKANNQKDGIKTYSYVVALLINYYKINPF